MTNDFGYNIRSEVIDAIMDTNTYSYAFDPIRLRSATARHVGNREWTRINANTNIYAANLLNQYTNILEGEAVSEPQHDLDGNMTATGDGWWYVWNGENRMILASNAEHVVTYAYDHQGRIVWKEIQRRDGETQSWEVEQAATLVWDGYNIVSTTIQHSSFTNHHSYVWGLDLSGSLQGLPAATGTAQAGAGGVGGLLSEIQDGELYFSTFDANGNITAYTDANGILVAHREFDAYGNTLAATGPMDDDFNFWFSSKYLDHETGLYYYGYRYYSPELGRWLSTDPIGEKGGVNRYAACLNDCISFYDSLGLYPTPIPDPLQWYSYALEGCNPGEWYGGGWHGPHDSGYQKYVAGNFVSFSHNCGVNLLNRTTGMTDGICNSAHNPGSDSRSRIALYAENDSACCERFRIWCNWSYKGSGHGGSKGNQGGLSVKPMWRTQYEVPFIKEGTPGHITRVSLDQPLTFEPPGEINIPRGSRKMVFLISAYIHAGERHSVAEIEESGDIQCSAICIDGH